ncbi:hypothetical protein JB92DRAFT_2877550 [Gautieria morchelliformis]|nr:hypothetical protein JB92DRAFT_2877550 [Gautieria morchelliformis]
MDMGSMQSPSVKNMDVSTTTTEELDRIRPDIIPVGAAELKPSVVSREQRTQEELKAIEALEELSRQKSVDIVAPPPPSIVRKDDLVSEPEAITHLASRPVGENRPQPDGPSSTLDSDVETPPVSSALASERPISQGKSSVISLVYSLKCDKTLQPNARLMNSRHLRQTRVAKRRRHETSPSLPRTRIWVMQTYTVLSLSLFLC